MNGFNAATGVDTGYKKPNPLRQNSQASNGMHPWHEHNALLKNGYFNNRDPFYVKNTFKGKDRIKIRSETQKYLSSMANDLQMGMNWIINTLLPKAESAQTPEEKELALNRINTLVTFDGNTDRYTIYGQLDQVFLKYQETLDNSGWFNKKTWELKHNLGNVLSWSGEYLKLRREGWKNERIINKNIKGREKIMQRNEEDLSILRINNINGQNNLTITDLEQKNLDLKQQVNDFESGKLALRNDVFLKKKEIKDSFKNGADLNFSDPIAVIKSYKSFRKRLFEQIKNIQINPQNNNPNPQNNNPNPQNNNPNPQNKTIPGKQCNKLLGGGIEFDFDNLKENFKTANPFDKFKLIIEFYNKYLRSKHKIDFSKIKNLSDISNENIRLIKTIFHPDKFMESTKKQIADALFKELGILFKR